MIRDAVFFPFLFPFFTVKFKGDKERPVSDFESSLVHDSYKFEGKRNATTLGYGKRVVRNESLGYLRRKI